MFSGKCLGVTTRSKIKKFLSRLARHKNDLHALLHETEEFGDSTDGCRNPRIVKFEFREIFTTSVLYPFIVILILMFLLQFSGQVNEILFLNETKCLFLFFSTTILLKIVDFSNIQTRVVRVEGEHADHKTNTTPEWNLLLPQIWFLPIIIPSLFLREKQIYFFKWANPGLVSIYYLSFHSNSIYNFTTN